ncbi:Zn-ribbon domain-containing OB-fold protein [Nocardioides sp. CPCC 206347]|uniref:Zn-ribbon domain-containing OB-fold protein n=1 Tax=unclassified Nocardioides TaxID=2615069 RepID=UPI00360949D4
MSVERYFADPVVTPVPLPDGSDLAHHQALRAHRLVLPCCSSCGTWSWPPDVICHNCHTFGLEWTETEPVGRIYSWTRAWHAVRPQLATRLPYLLVLVELPGAGGVRLIGNLLGPAEREVSCGTPVRGVFEDSADGAYTLLQWTTDPED